MAIAIVITQLAAPFQGVIFAASEATLGRTRKGGFAPADVGNRRPVDERKARSAGKPLSLHLVQHVFSASPTDQEFFVCGILPEVMVPMSKPSLKEENVALAAALMSFHGRSNRDDFSALTGFIDSYPSSTWRASLETNLGILYRSHGYFSRALSVWESAWNTGKMETGRMAKATIDCAGASLAELMARLGRFDTLKPLLDELDGRCIRGPMTEYIAGAREGLWAMENAPGRAFRCGPMALSAIKGSFGLDDAVCPRIDGMESSPKGTSLSQIALWASELGMPTQMAKREAGAEFQVPSVVHWKSGHFAGIVEKKGDLYRVQDATFGGELWMSANALEDESSGYFLVRSGILGEDWKSVSVAEGSTVWGKGQCGNGQPGATRPCDEKVPPCQDAKGRGMPVYAFHALVASLNIVDTPVGVTLPLGQDLMFTVTYNQREAGQPAIAFDFSNLGFKWSHRFQSYIEDQGKADTMSPVLYHHAGGGYDTNFVDYVESEVVHFKHELESRAKLVRIDSTTYERTFPDGSKEYFVGPDTTSARKLFLSSEVTPQGVTTTLLYNNDVPNRLESIRADNPGGIFQMEIEYDSDAITYNGAAFVPNDPSRFYRIKKVTDPFGREALFDYDTEGRLIKITDVIGLESEFTYDAGDFITAMKTPYGTTTFSMSGGGGTDRTLQAIDPLGQREMLKYYVVGGYDSKEDAKNVPSNINVINNNLQYRNSLYWDKKAMSETDANSPDTSKAKVYHWLHADAAAASNSGIASPILESIKNPVEGRIWYRYPGQSDSMMAPASGNASAVGRVLDDGQQHIELFHHNDYGNLTSYIDPQGRVTTNVYHANQIDLLEVRQKVGSSYQLLSSYTYNSMHLPLTMTDTAGKTTRIGYNAHGQVQAVTNPANDVVFLKYDQAGYLTNTTFTNINGVIGSSEMNFTYDADRRIYSVTDSDGYSITNDYDNLDRLTKTTYPDGSYEQIIYDKLDAVLMRDRMGRWSSQIYDPLRRVVANVDSEGQTTRFDWCSCNGLASLTDPLGRVTTWMRDLQGRVTHKVYPDGTFTAYNYEANSGRLAETIDALSQTNRLEYYVDGTLRRSSYLNAVVATPPVTYTYDSSFGRLTSMIDGTGTTVYGYHAINNPPGAGAGRLYVIDGPLSDATDRIELFYDDLGRVTNRTLNGTVERIAFDGLGRITNVVNALGTFTYSYVGATPRMNEIVYPNNQKTVFDWQNNAGDQRLASIWHKTSSAATISKFSYEYDPEGQIKTWTQLRGTADPSLYHLDYDRIGQLLGARVVNGTTAAIIKQFMYQYDKSGNRTGEQIDLTVSTNSYSSLNQLTNRTGVAGGPVRVFGYLSETGTVTVAGAPAVMRDGTNFSAYVTPAPGASTSISIVAKDLANPQNQSSESRTITTSAGQARQMKYDLNGNLVWMSGANFTNWYDWDAKNQLVVFENLVTAQTRKRTEFTYNGLGQRVRIVEKDDGSVVSDKRFIWCYGEICEERAANGTTVNKQFFDMGERRGSSNYYYTRDHLGSIREVTDSSQVVQAAYDYDPYGQRAKTSGSFDCDFGFTGHYYHVTSGLHLAWFRAYDVDSGRWISRDPIAEGGGLNLYSYVSGNPTGLYDPFGLEENSPSNIAKRKKIDQLARGYKGSKAWAKDAKKDQFPPGSNKCNKFVYDVCKEAGAEPLVTVQNKKRPPLAAEYADPKTKIPNWRPLKKGEKPQPGDIAAYKLTAGGSAFSGHTGFITSGEGNSNSNTSAHGDAVYPDPGQFEENPGTVYRRYTGD